MRGEETAIEAQLRGFLRLLRGTGSPHLGSFGSRHSHRPDTSKWDPVNSLPLHSRRQNNSRVFL